VLSQRGSIENRVLMPTLYTNSCNCLTICQILGDYMGAQMAPGCTVVHLKLKIASSGFPHVPAFIEPPLKKGLIRSCVCIFITKEFHEKIN